MFFFLNHFLFKGNDLLYTCVVVYKRNQYNLLGDIYMHRHNSNMLPQYSMMSILSSIYFNIILLSLFNVVSINIGN